jgi:uncharacterized membrane protein (DUF2068 family)
MARNVVKGADRTAGNPILIIGVFKLVKAALLVGVGVVGLVAAPSAMVHRIRYALAWLGLSPGHHGFSQLLGKLGSFNHDTARKLAAASLCYGLVFAVEGVGLLYKRRWAEWLTVIVTASFIPLEIYELVEHFSAGKIVTVIASLAIVAYLVMRRVAERRSVSYRLRHALG